MNESTEHDIATVMITTTMPDIGQVGGEITVCEIRKHTSFYIQLQKEMEWEDRWFAVEADDGLPF